MAITKRQFLELEFGHAIIGALNGIFPVVRNRPNRPLPDVPGDREVFLSDPEGNEFVVGWHDDLSGIVDDAWRGIPHFNHPRARIVQL